MGTQKLQISRPTSTGRAFIVLGWALLNNDEVSRLPLPSSLLTLPLSLSLVSRSSWCAVP